MDKQTLYDEMTKRKIKPADFNSYEGGNGRVDRCVDLFKRGIIRSGGVLMDFGGGIGDLCYALRDRFDRRIVVDISKKNLEAARSKGCEVEEHDVDTGPVPINGFFEPPPESELGEFLTRMRAKGSHQDGMPCLARGYVDTVTALDFIEHIIDPEGFARECFALLKPGGQVFINTPNIQFWRHLRSLVYDGVFPHTSGDREVYHGGHLAFYTVDDMRKIFGAAGFKPGVMIRDAENYDDPPNEWVEKMNCRNQQELVDACVKLGSPNLLYLCEKPL